VAQFDSPNPDPTEPPKMRCISFLDFSRSSRISFVSVSSSTRARALVRTARLGWQIIRKHGLQRQALNTRVGNDGATCVFLATGW